MVLVECFSKTAVIILTTDGRNNNFCLKLVSLKWNIFTIFPWTSSKYYTASLFSIRASYPLKVIKVSVCNSTFGENLIDLREERATK